MEEKKDLYRLQITVSEMTFFYFIFAKKKKVHFFFPDLCRIPPKLYGPFVRVKV